MSAYHFQDHTMWNEAEMEEIEAVYPRYLHLNQDHADEHQELEALIDQQMNTALFSPYQIKNFCQEIDYCRHQEITLDTLFGTCSQGSTPIPTQIPSEDEQAEPPMDGETETLTANDNNGITQAKIWQWWYVHGIRRYRKSFRHGAMRTSL